MPEPREWLTVEQVADLLQVHQETVRRWIRAGTLPAFVFGGRKTGYRVARADLEAFIQARAGAPLAVVSPAGPGISPAARAMLPRLSG